MAMRDVGIMEVEAGSGVAAAQGIIEKMGRALTAK